LDSSGEGMAGAVWVTTRGTAGMPVRLVWVRVAQGPSLSREAVKEDSARNRSRVSAARRAAAAMLMPERLPSASGQLAQKILVSPKRRVTGSTSAGVMPRGLPGVISTNTPS